MRMYYEMKPKYRPIKTILKNRKVSFKSLIYKL